MKPALLNNRYRIIRELGTGGFGQTFLAEDTQMPSKRRCAIKELKPVPGNPQVYQMVQERFKREAAVLEELSEGNDQIPQLYAYFESKGQFYIVQEWVEGVTLTNKVQTAGKLSENKVREILASILPVLDYVHSHRIVHRDIKPDNIILRLADGKPVLIDFGAVKEAMGKVLSSSGTPGSIAIGTPGFMPAEQAAGRPVYSSDLYSLGLTAIYMLTGKLPQELEVDSRTSEILWHSYAAGVSRNLVRVLDRAIQFNPSHRFATPRQMLDALQPDAPSMVSTQATLVVSPGSPKSQPAAPRTLAASTASTQATLVVSAPPPQPQTVAPRTKSEGGVSWAVGAIIGGIFGVSFLVAYPLATMQFKPLEFFSSASTPAYNFPLNVCGDLNPPGVDTWYPVWIDNTEENLDVVRSQYCGDAFRKYVKADDRNYIQVASFLDRSKAEEFAKLMQKEVGSGKVGETSNNPQRQARSR